MQRITPFLAAQAFDPEALHDMSAVFDGVCDRLGLAGHRDSTTEVVAKTIIELAQRGVRDSSTLRRMTLKEFGIND